MSQVGWPIRLDFLFDFKHVSKRESLVPCFSYFAEKANLVEVIQIGLALVPTDRYGNFSLSDLLGGL